MLGSLLTSIRLSLQLVVDHSFRHKHELNKLSIVEFTRALGVLTLNDRLVEVWLTRVHVHHPNHFVNLILAHLIAKVHHAVAQLGRCDITAHVAVKHLEGLDHSLLRVAIFQQLLHE